VKQKFFIVSLIALILFTSSINRANAREPQFGVKEGEEYTYKLATATRNGETDNANFTLHTIWGGWETNNTNYVLKQDDTWSYVVENTTVAKVEGDPVYYGLNSSLKVGGTKVDSGGIYFWLFHDLAPWYLVNGLGLFESVFQDIHADNDTYWEQKATALIEKTNMSLYETFDVQVSDTAVNAHIVPVDKSYHEAQKFEVNLDKGLITYMEVQLNKSNEWITADHLKIVCETVEPIGDFENGSGAPSFEFMYAFFALTIATAIGIRKRK